MSSEESKKNEKITQVEYLEVFAKTGHDALRALLIVSCGSAVTFLAFLGAVVGSDRVAPALDAAVPGFQLAVASFIKSIICSLIAYALTFTAHGAFFLRMKSDRPPKWRSRLNGVGVSLTVFAMLAEFVCIVYFAIGGFRAAEALAELVEAMKRSG